MAESVTHNVRAIVWTPCSVMAALGCGGILLLWLLGMCAVLVSGSPEEPVHRRPPAAGR